MRDPITVFVIGVLGKSSIRCRCCHDTPVFVVSIFGNQEWAVESGIETATFHVLTPYPGTKLYKKMNREGKILHHNWDLYDTRHAVFRPANISAEELVEGYWRSYERFYEWKNIFRSASVKSFPGMFRHLAYSGGWKKMEWFWLLVLKLGWLPQMRPALEAVLSTVTEAYRKEVAPVGGLRKPPLSRTDSPDKLLSPEQ